MIRLLGAITGSALALATLLVVIGIPQFKAEPSTIDRNVVTLPLETSPVEDVQTAMSKAEQVPGDSPPLEAPSDAPEPEPAATETVAEIADDAIIEDETDATESDNAAMIAAHLPPAITPDDAQNWYAFWSPFRSEIAAAGFVAQLQRVTGLDYKVVKVKPGVYEVAFAYSDDTDISNNLSQITAATGLQMPDG